MATAGFVLMTLLVVYVIIDLDRPRRGLFRREADALVTLRASLPAPDATGSPGSRTP